MALACVLFGSTVGTVAVAGAAGGPAATGTAASVGSDLDDLLPGWDGDDGESDGDESGSDSDGSTGDGSTGDGSTGDGSTDGGSADDGSPTDDETDADGEPSDPALTDGLERTLDGTTDLADGTTDLLEGTTNGTTDSLDAVADETTVFVDDTVEETTVAVDETTGETTVRVNETTHDLTDLLDALSDDELSNVTVVVDGTVENATDFLDESSADATGYVDNVSTAATDATRETTNGTTDSLDEVVSRTVEDVDATVEEANGSAAAVGAALEADLEGATVDVDGTPRTIEAVETEAIDLVAGTAETTTALSVEIATESGDLIEGTVATVGDTTYVVLDETVATVESTTANLVGTTDAILDGVTRGVLGQGTADGSADEPPADDDPTEAEETASGENESGSAIPDGASDVAEAAVVGLMGLAALSTAGATGGGAGTTAGLTSRSTLVRRLFDLLSRLPVEVAGAFRYSRYDDSDPLEHDERRRIYEAIQADPGLYLSEVSERNDVALSTVRHHVRVLEDEGLLTTVKVHGKRRYFPVGEDDVELLSALAEPSKRRVLERLAELGGAHNGRLADDLDVDPSTVSHHLSSLEDDGLVVRERDGRTIVNRLAPAVERAIRGEDVTDPDAAAPAPADD